MWGKKIHSYFDLSSNLKSLRTVNQKNTWNTVVFLKKLNIILEAKSNSLVGKFVSNDEGSVIDPRLFKFWIVWTPREIWKINTRIMLCFSLQINKLWLIFSLKLQNKYLFNYCHKPTAALIPLLLQCINSITALKRMHPISGLLSTENNLAISIFLQGHNTPPVFCIDLEKVRSRNPGSSM